MYTNVHSGFIYDIQKLKTPQMFISTWTDHQTEYNGLLLSYEKEWAINICNMNESQIKKTQKEYIVCDSIYTQFQKILIHLQ